LTPNEVIHPPNPDPPPTDSSGFSTSAEECLDFPWQFSLDSLSNPSSDFEDYYLNVYQAGEGIGDIYKDNYDEHKPIGSILEN